MTSSDDKTVWQQIHDKSIEVLEEQMRRKEHELLQAMRNPEDREPYPGDVKTVCALCSYPEDHDVHKGPADTPNLHLYDPIPAPPGLEAKQYFVALGVNERGRPPRFGNCTCQCHVIPMNHVTACCGPWLDREVPSGLTQVLSAKPHDEEPEEEFSIELATAIICAWLDDYKKQKLPHVRDVLTYHKIVAFHQRLLDWIQELEGDPNA